MSTAPIEPPAGSPAPAERPVRFVHRGRVHEVHGPQASRSVLNWLREDAHCTGTKEGCNEGDCGACTVLIAEPDEGRPSAGPDDPVVDGLRLRTVNSCIQFLPTLHGKALLTVEDLADFDPPPGPGPVLHPVQQALVEHHGSQCGFCTPGFAVSLLACYEGHQASGCRPSREALADALAGNLCRCTGYRPILDAGLAAFEAAPRRLPAAALRAQLEALAAGEAPGPVVHAGGFHAPRSLDELAALRLARPQATLLAGSTDIGLWVSKQFRALGEILYLGAVPELKRLAWVDETLVIGAGVLLEDAWRALAALDPGLREMGRRFAAPPVRHAGTLGGNVANGSPIGDGPPVLMALDARLRLRRGTRQRVLPLDGFYLDYMKNQLEPGEFLEAIELDRPAPGTVLRGEKLSKRHDCDISAVSAGFALRLDAAGRVAAVRLAFGGLAATVRRATQAEAAVLGQPWTEATLRAAQAALARDVQPLSDLRASAAYRLRGAQALLERLWLETRPVDPLPPAALRLRPAPV